MCAGAVRLAPAIDGVTSWLLLAETACGVAQQLGPGRIHVGAPEDPQISRHHAAIVWQDNRFVVEDSRSSNGTYVNEERVIGTMVLFDQDVVRMGNQSFLVRLADRDDSAVTEVKAFPGAPSKPHVTLLLLAIAIALGALVVWQLKGHIAAIFQNPPQQTTTE